MKTQPLNEQLLKMQKIAGVISENQYIASLEEIKSKKKDKKDKEEKEEKEDKKVGKKTKMTKDELKEAIRQEIIATLTEDGDLGEAKKGKEEEEEISTEEETIEEPTDDAIDTTALTSPQDVQKELMDAIEAAKQLGDKKLVRQIGNALTYFTRTQISSDESGA
jgi:hypothetical protein